MRGLFVGGALVGILVGIALGLVISWSLWRVSYTEADPADLRLDLKDDYLRMIAASYSLDGDLPRAVQRLGVLQLTRPALQVGEQAQHEPNPLYQQALVRLALDLNQPAVVWARPTYTPRPTRTPTSGDLAVTPVAPATRVAPTQPLSPDRSTPEPTAPPPTLVPNPDAPRFQLKSKSSFGCAASGGHAHIEVDVQDAQGKPVSGIGVEINWNAGDEVIYTGLKPERGMGYAALDVGPGTFSVRLADTGESDVVTPLKVDGASGPCAPDASGVYGWKLVFQRVTG